MTGSGDHLRRDALRTVARAVGESAQTRLAEIGDGQGCEAAAARAFEQGRLHAVEVDMWVALGLTPPGLPPLAEPNHPPT